MKSLLTTPLRLSREHLLTLMTLCAGFGIVVLAVSFAAGLVASIESEAGMLAGGAQVVTDAGASGGRAIKFAAAATPTPAPTTTPTATPAPTATPSASCALPKYPTPSCTGRLLSSGYATTISGAYTATTAGATLDNWHIAGDLVINAANITIKNSQIDGTIYNDQGSSHFSFTVTDTTIGKTTGCVGQPGINDSNYTATRVHVQGHDDGFRVGPPGNVAVRDSYASFCFLNASQAPPDGSHTDGVQAVCAGVSCAGVIIDHNTFDGRNGPATNMLNLTDTALSGVTASNNLLMDGAYVIDAWWHSGANWTFTNNRLVNNVWAYGAVTAENTCAHQTWSGNTLVTIDTNYNITSTIGSQPCVD